MASLESDEIINLLNLKPHPEGGCYRETFRDEAGFEGRAHSTAIYFLLRAGETSRWHRVDAVEVWHWYAGQPLILEIATEASAPATIVMGSNIASGERPQAVVPAGHWQRARSAGAWTLVGCTVSPGFTFSGFEIAPDEKVPTVG